MFAPCDAGAAISRCQVSWRNSIERRRPSVGRCTAVGTQSHFALSWHLLRGGEGVHRCCGVNCDSAECRSARRDLREAGQVAPNLAGHSRPRIGAIPDLMRSAPTLISADMVQAEIARAEICCEAVAQIQGESQQWAAAPMRAMSMIVSEGGGEAIAFGRHLYSEFHEERHTHTRRVCGTRSLG